MERNLSVHSLRSQIQFEAIQSNTNQLFQDKTLRPILKFQHEIILAIFNNFLQKHKLYFNQLNSEQRNNKIEQIFKQNLALQSLFKGLIIGLFDKEEIDYWLLNKNEINKRMIQLLIKRIQSSME